jgi:hypothetical protein
MTAEIAPDTHARLGRVFQTMGLEDLRRVNKYLVAEINARHRAVAEKAASKFRLGDLIEFVDDKRGRKVTARIERINQKSISCRELEGLKQPWRVSAHFCRLVGS